LAKVLREKLEVARPFLPPNCGSALQRRFDLGIVESVLRSLKIWHLTHVFSIFRIFTNFVSFTKSCTITEYLDECPGMSEVEKTASEQAIKIPMDLSHYSSPQEDAHSSEKPAIALYVFLFALLVAEIFVILGYRINIDLTSMPTAKVVRLFDKTEDKAQPVAKMPSNPKQKQSRRAWEENATPYPPRSETMTVPVIAGCAMQGNYCRCYSKSGMIYPARDEMCREIAKGDALRRGGKPVQGGDRLRIH